jgi:hypothetical protein
MECIQITLLSWIGTNTRELGKRVFPTDFVKVGFAIFIRQSLPWIA